MGLSSALVVILSGVYSVPWQTGVAYSNPMVYLANANLMWLVSRIEFPWPLFAPVVAGGLVAIGGVLAIWPPVGRWLTGLALYADMAVVVLSGSRLLFGVAVGAGSTAALTWGTANLVLLIATLVMGILPLITSLRMDRGVGEPTQTDRLRRAARRAGAINLVLAAVLFAIYGSLSHIQGPLFQNLMLAGCQSQVGFPRYVCDPVPPPRDWLLASNLLEALLVPVTGWLLMSCGVLLRILVRRWSPRPHREGA